MQKYSLILYQFLSLWKQAIGGQFACIFFYEKIHQKDLDFDALNTKRESVSFLPLLNLDDKRETERTYIAFFR